MICGSVFESPTVNGNRKYVIDISGELPTILLELDPQDNMAIKKTYIYANGEILAQHNGDYTYPRYFYLHDRLGSVRLVVDESGTTQNSYTYNPFGELFPTECAENVNVSNPFKFTGQFFDDEISQYYLRARQYDPALMRFTGRDPERGKREEPLTLHKYLYCLNSPVDYVDPTGESLLGLLAGFFTDAYDEAKDAAAGLGALDYAKEVIGSAATWFNATISGTINMFFGPDSVSESKKFAIGFAAGALEIQVGMRFGPAAGGTVGSTLKETLNQACSNDPLLSWSAAGKIGASALIGLGAGGFAQWYDPQDAIEKFTLLLISADRNAILYDYEQAKKLYE